jgi:hypothetical protein
MAGSIWDVSFQRHCREVYERAELRAHEEATANGEKCDCTWCYFGVPAKLSGDDPIAVAFDKVRADSGKKP